MWMKLIQGEGRRERERVRLRGGQPNERVGGGGGGEMDGEAARQMRVLIWVVGTYCLCGFEWMEGSHQGDE